MGNGEVGSKYRHGVAEDQVFVSIEDPFLIFREMIQAEETSPFICVLLGDVGHAALDSPGIVLEADRKSAAGNAPLPEVFK
jgi:hypothetical protein